MKTLVVVTFATGAITGPALAGVVYNLPLLLAFDVLQQTLAKARDEKLFQCSRNQLGNLMESSKSCLPWNDWSALRDGVRRRNEVAHDGQFSRPSAICKIDISNVEAQLHTLGNRAAAWNLRLLFREDLDRLNFVDDEEASLGRGEHFQGMCGVREWARIVGACGKHAYRLSFRLSDVEPSAWHRRLDQHPPWKGLAGNEPFDDTSRDARRPLVLRRL